MIAIPPSTAAHRKHAALVQTSPISSSETTSNCRMPHLLTRNGMLFPIPYFAIPSGPTPSVSGWYFYEYATAKRKQKAGGETPAQTTSKNFHHRHVRVRCTLRGLHRGLPSERFWKQKKQILPVCLGTCATCTQEVGHQNVAPGMVNHRKR